MIVGLLGKKRSGKDSFARTLVEERGFVRFAFADPMKEALLRINPIIEEPIYVAPDSVPDYYVTTVAEVVGERGWEAAKEIPEVRRLLQHFGVAIREIQPDFWVSATMKLARLYEDVVITDVRFPNEAFAVVEAGGKTVRIERPDLDTSDTHESETALDNFVADYTVFNDGTLDQLANAARKLRV